MCHTLSCDGAKSYHYRKLPTCKENGETESFIKTNIHCFFLFHVKHGTLCNFFCSFSPLKSSSFTLFLIAFSIKAVRIQESAIIKDFETTKK